MALIQKGIAESRLLQQLIDRLNASGVIVYWSPIMSCRRTLTDN